MNFLNGFITHQKKKKKSEKKRERKIKQKNLLALSPIEGTLPNTRPLVQQPINLREQGTQSHCEGH